MPGNTPVCDRIFQSVDITVHVVPTKHYQKILKKCLFGTTCNIFKFPIAQQCVTRTQKHVECQCIEAKDDWTSDLSTKFGCEFLKILRNITPVLPMASRYI